MTARASFRPPRNAPRRPGRPRGSSGDLTRDRVIAAAAASFAEHGFRGATLADIAERAGITAAPIYNYFASKEELFFVACREALEALTGGRPPRSADALAEGTRAFMSPAFQQTRRLLVELYNAASRSPKLAALISEWHQESLQRWLGKVTAASSRSAALVKVYFMVVLGLAQLDTLSAIEARRSDVEDIVFDLLQHLIQIDGSSAGAP